MKVNSVFINNINLHKKKKPDEGQSTHLCYFRITIHVVDIFLHSLGFVFFSID